MVLALLLAFRVFWVPAHLALEPHDDVASHAATHSHPSDDHGHDHEPSPGEQDDDHPPHAAADHLTWWIGPRTSADWTVELPCADVAPALVSPATLVCLVADQTPAPVPKRAPPRCDRARAPPIVRTTT